MNISLKLSIRCIAFLSLLCAGSVLHAQTASNANVRYSAFPPSNSESAPPIVMLTMSRDHQYFFKAYNDFTDLDPENDNGVETTYTNTITYYGYFQSDVCYSYESDVFQPKQLQNTPFYCDDVSGDWSGNFLNWVSMTRMDVVRKVLYGGKRVVDMDGKTILERAFLPPDAHAFAKYYNGLDIPKLTPFGSDVIENNGDAIDNVNEGITICNVTEFYPRGGSNADDGNSADSEKNTRPPVMRMAKGNFRLWASNERMMCNWNRGNGNGNNNIDSLSDPKKVRLNGLGSRSVTYNAIDYVRSDDSNVEVEVSSGIDNRPDSPKTEDELTVGGKRDIVVRVQACVTDADGNVIDFEACREYPGTGSNPSWKPVGLLQRFGEDGLMKFGLITGSYTNNLTGGTLRKNVSDFSDEVNVDTDGSFTRGDESIVGSIDAFRIFGYDYSVTEYSDCRGNRDALPNGACRAWGNPISEIYRDSLRYLAGVSQPTHSSVNDSNFIGNLKNSFAWDKPISKDNQCSDISNIVFNGSVNTYDMDASNISIVDLQAAGTVNDWINKVGAGEGINGGKFFVGESGAAANEQCTAKTVGQLSDVRGLCPEGPSKEGGYGLSGLAYMANQTDLYPTLDGEQNVNTYGIALASADPVMTVPVVSGDFKGQFVNIIPSSIQFNGGSGAMVDFQVVTPHSPIPLRPNQYFGRFFVSYEVSVAGADFDTDAIGTIEYVLDENTGEITVTTVALKESAGSTAGLFGFVIGGTTQDGFQAFSGDQSSGNIGANYLPDDISVPGCENCTTVDATGSDRQFGPQSHTFKLGTSGAKLLEGPLYYAAKWGSFEDRDNDGTPNSQEEWDSQENFTGNAVNGGDGVPDNYFLVANPSQLEVALANTFQKILANRTSSGTAPANLANADGSGGIIVQAIYYDNQANSTTNESVAWTGELHAFFIDEYGFFREDSRSGGVRGELDGPSIDTIFAFNYDATAEVLKVNRFNLQDNSKPFDPDTNPLVFSSSALASELQTVWSADNKLSELENSTIDVQRDYKSLVSSTGASRHILTWFDKNRNNKVDAGEEIDFTADMTSEKDASGNLFSRYLGFGGQRRAKEVIDFVRGKDGIDGLRGRLLTDRIDDGSQKQVVKRLGDVVNSTPLIIGAPSSAYDLRFGDTSYSAFRAKYANRRNVMYIGGNDGLLHAFNVGYRTFSNDTRVAFTKADPKDASKTAHDLGAELWAYAPYNLLPHLRWMADPFYSHVFYVDGDPVSYDVNIFDDDEDHPNGWGTILVVGMRLGGGEIGVNLDNNNDNNLNGRCRDWCAQSSYIVLDITNPEKPPRVIAEINDNLLNSSNASTGAVSVANNDLFHTHSRPALVKQRRAGAGNNWLTPAENSWKLVFGSGPKYRGDFDTNEVARLYSFDLKTLTLDKQNVKNGGSNVPRSFVGDLTTADWNDDYKDDVVYFGTVGKTGATGVADDHTGQMYRYRVDQDDTKLFYAADRPISTQPIPRRSRGQNFLYFGTGRYYHQDDSETALQEKYYGLKEANDGSYAAPVSGTVVDVTNIDVSRDRTVDNAPSGVDTFDKLVDYIIDNDSVAGWSRKLAVTVAKPNERISSESTAVRSQILFTTFEPTEDICSANSGSSSLFVLDLITGTPSAFGGLGFESEDEDADAVASINLGVGRASFPIVLVASGLDANKGRAIIQLDTGEIVAPEVTLGEPVSPQRVNWREITGDE